MRRLIMLCILGLVLGTGCGESERKFGKRVVEITKVPANLLEIAKKEIPGVEFNEAWTNHAVGDEAIHSYEIRGRNPSTGKIREVRVGLDGKILEKE